MTLYHTLLTVYVVVINLTAYTVMCYDKLQAKKNGRRIRESSLFTLALLLGAGGIYLGMKAPLYHKAAKAKFRFWVPVCLILNLLLVLFAERAGWH